MGTILVELVLRVPFLSGDSDADQLKKTFHAMGTPTEEDWPVSSFHRKLTLSDQ
jgi:cyclin-dependent kinase 7